MIPRTFESGEVPLFLMLDGVTDVRNFGSIARTAECMGVHSIIIPTQNSAQVTADAVRTSAGALNHIPVIREERLDRTVNYLKESGFEVVACTEKSDKFLKDINLTGPSCLVMGSEEVGISKEIMESSNHKGSIEMRGKVSSLNVGSACSMALYEIQRQRSQ